MIGAAPRRRRRRRRLGQLHRDPALSSRPTTGRSTRRRRRTADQRGRALRRPLQPAHRPAADLGLRPRARARRPRICARSAAYAVTIHYDGAVANIAFDESAAAEFPPERITVLARARWRRSTTSALTVHGRKVRRARRRERRWATRSSCASSSPPSEGEPNYLLILGRRGAGDAERVRGARRASGPASRSMTDGVPGRRSLEAGAARVRGGYLSALQRNQRSR